MNSQPLMTQAQYAAHRGVGKPAVSNWKKAGHLIFAEGEDGRLYVDAARTDARLNAKIDPTRGRPATGAAAEPSLPLAPAAKDGAGELAEVRTDLLREQRIGAKLKNAAMVRELVPLAEAERRAGELGRMSRERMHSLVRTTAERLAAERDPRAITAVLAGEIDRVFAELADQVDAGALEAGEEDATIAELDAEDVADAGPDGL